MICNDIEIPFKFDRNLILLEASKPTHDELKNLPLLVITSGIEWNPDRIRTYSHKDLECKPLPSNNIGIVNLSAHEIVCDRLQNGHNVRCVRMTLDSDNLKDESSLESSFDRDVDTERGVDDILSVSTDDDSEACRTRSKHHNNASNWKRVSNIRDDVAQFTGCVKIGVDDWKRDNFSDSFEAVFATLLCSSYAPKELCDMLKMRRVLVIGLTQHALKSNISFVVKFGTETSAGSQIQDYQLRGHSKSYMIMKG